MFLIHNERTKLSANWLNGASLAIFGAVRALDNFGQSLGPSL